MKRLFIVEDEAVVALELKDHLRTLGYEVCGHAVRAETALREIPAAAPDLVLMDIKLGGGMSGIELAEALREVADVPVIFLTAYSDAELTRRASSTGGYGYLVKPYDPRVLGANIELALRRREQLERAPAASASEFRRLSEEVAHGGEQHEPGEMVGVRRYLATVVDDLRRVVPAPGVDVELQVETAYLPVELTRLMGMAVDELVTNALTHGFRNRRGGRVDVRVSRAEDGDLVLGVHDDGVGFPEGFDSRTARSFGWELIRTLAEQLAARVEATTDRGAHVTLRFRAPIPEAHGDTGRTARH